jgi:hypothetical protein
VTWQGELNHAYIKKNEIVTMFIYLLNEQIIFEVNINDYPGLGLLKKGAIVTVEGIIEHVGAYFELKDARIISVIPHDAKYLSN